MSAAFSSKQEQKLLLANSVWQKATRFGKFSIDFSLKSEEPIVGEVEH